MDEKFLLVSLEEEKAKKVAEVISNSTARRILDFRTEKKEGSESEIANALNVPLSTVHYNIQNLLKCDLIESKEFRWSEKGKEIDIFRIAKKYIVIAPKSISGLQERLRSALPSVLISAIGAGFVYWLTRSATIAPATPTLMERADEVSIVAAQALPIAPTTIINPALWFLIGAWLVILIFVLYSWRSRKNGK